MARMKLSGFLGRAIASLRGGNSGIESLLQRDPSTLNEEERAKVDSFLTSKRGQETGMKRQRDLLLRMRRGRLGRNLFKNTGSTYE